jgi:uncharacterized protein YjbJ (UPF0337 family)
VPAVSSHTKEKIMPKGKVEKIAGKAQKKVGQVKKALRK